MKSQQMKQTSAELDTIELVGITVRTSYDTELAWDRGNIFPCVQRYFHDQLFDLIPHRKSPGKTYCVYFDYESDYTGAYSYFIGEEVDSLDSPLPSELKRLSIESQTYAKFTAGPGAMPEVLRNAWQDIWEMSPKDFGGERRYIADFEIYDERAADHENIVLDIYVGIAK